jgi:tetrapyrrole methylase family protein / MazG family protein
MSQPFDDLVEIMAKLRAPNGCPWDRKQTHESLKPYLLEETYEVLETIDEQNLPKLKEELGDLFLQILFHAQIATEHQTFTIREVMEELAEKLVRRHPHVFAPSTAETQGLGPEQVYSRWDEIKREERAQAGEEGSALDGVPKVLPALLRAYQVQARASRVGFDWPTTSLGLEQLLDKVEEEIKELREAVAAETARTKGPHDGKPEVRIPKEVEAELGDVLFSLVNLARVIKVNPEDALRQAVNRFTSRFHYIEGEASRSGRRIDELTFTEMDQLWEEAKSQSRVGRRRAPKQGP